MHLKKMVAPIIITLILFIYLGFYVFVGLSIDDISLTTKLLAGIIPACFAGVSIYVLIERIKEIRSGEEDDLSQY